ncbi:MAG: single-stranded-DNA-specific exonuclease [Alphaproteobacteria bacterium]|nr:MAG: single-stranded-DNA-specific exonuclease [Alphaproteobacteria bacterium]
MLTVDGERPFLGVERSVLGQFWRERLDQRGRNTALAIAQSGAMPELVARVLAGRGVGAEEAAAFLAPAIRDLMPDPSRLTDMDRAAARIAAAIARGERVAIFGDYDVDGAASGALLARFLRHHGLEPEIYIPDRIFEGYGPSPEAIAELAGRGARLIVTVDCGATSFEALEHAAGLGVDVVVLDHHQMDEAGPPAVALVNPNRHDDLSRLGHLCAAGVTFMALVATVRELRRTGRYGTVPPPDLLRWLDLVALATICDVVPLKGLNRAFVVRGLAAMHTRDNAGLAALARVARLDGPVRPYHLGFLLGPRINAGGRIGDAGLGARLLSTEDPAEAAAIAERLEELNRQRQAQESAMLAEAVAEAEAEIGGGAGPAVLVVASERWHPGIVGIIASRLKDRYRRPAVAVAFDRLGRGTGSGRSLAGVDLGAAVRRALAEGLIVKGGGHAMAAGITVERARLAELRGFLEERLGAAVAAAREVNVLKLDGALTARSATLDLHDLVEKAGPYGPGHALPIFAFPAHAVRGPRLVGHDHVSLTLRSGDGASLRAVAFRAADTPLGRLLLEAPPSLHVAGTIAADWWQGSRRLQLRVLDAARPGYV